MRQMLLSEGEDEEEIHYSSTPWRAHTHANRPCYFRISAVPAFITQVVLARSDTWMHIALAPIHLRSSEDARIIE